MPKDVTINVTGREAADELRSLYRWLRDEREFRGSVRLVEAPPQPGALGGALETLAVALGPSGVGVALTSVIISWIRHRKSDVSCKVTHSNGATIEISASQVSKLDNTALLTLVTDMSDTLEQRAGDEDASAADGGATGAQ